MLTILIFAITVISAIALNLIFNINNLSPTYIIIALVFGVIICMAINAVVATIVCKCVPEKCFLPNKKMFQVSKFERKFYNFIKVKSWKDSVLELGSLNGFKKNKLANPNDNTYIEKFIIECNRGYLTHLLSIFLGSLIIFAYPNNIKICIGVPILFANFLINYMSVAILRYNIPKLQVLLKRNEKHKNNTEEQKCSV